MRVTRYLLSAGVLLYSVVWAGCGEGEGQCYYYKGGVLHAEGACSVTVCAATDQYFHSTWQWHDSDNIVEISLSDDQEQRMLINGKAAYAFPVALQNENMICYGVIGSDELMCNDSGVF